MMRAADRYRYLKALARFCESIGVRLHKHSGTFPDPHSRFRGCWLDRDSVHFIQPICSPDHLAHEIGHYLLLQESDRIRVQPGCLQDQDISTCFEDFGAEAMAFAILWAAGVPTEILMEHPEDFSAILDPDEWRDEASRYRYSYQFLLGRHLGVKLLQFCGMTDKNYPSMKTWFVTEPALYLHQLINDSFSQRNKHEPKIDEILDKFGSRRSHQ